MMSKVLLSAGMLLGSIMLPLSAHAYIEPEDMLNETDYSTRFFDPPPSRREISSVVEEQRLRSAERREAEQAAIKPQPEPAPEDESLRGAAPAQDSSLTEVLQLIEAIGKLQGAPATDAASTADIRDQRILERIKAQREAAEREAYYNMLLGTTEGESLRSGAPLTETGPATVVVTLAIAGAIGETWRRVRKTERRVMS